MFAWICPKCGKEIPPQYDGCPEWCPEYDKQKAYLKQTGPARVEATSPIVKNLMQIEGGTMSGGTYTGATYLSGATVAPPRPGAAQENAEGSRFRPAAAAISYEATPPDGGSAGASLTPINELRTGAVNANADGSRPMNPFLVTLLAAVVFLALGYAGFKYYDQSKGALGASTNMVGPGGNAGGHRLNRVLSVTALRFVPGKNKQMEARFVIVNGGAAQTPTFSGTVHVRPKDAAADETPMVSFDLKDVALGPYESREMQAPLNKTLKPYELPDGNLVRTDLVISEPAQ
ncbi:MAG: hypothetical protein MUF01_04935 [Bryobacterales bacterium]|jgi:hypothetical protein|nr:hypothetical protein [Bryobacterales bacterium]